MQQVVRVKNKMQKIDHSKNVIEIDNVSFSYGKGDVIKNVSLNIHQGDYIGVVGPNGAGKTTLLKIILGLLKPTSGVVRKSDIAIGYVPQKATNFDQNFPATVMEVVLMGRYGKRGLFQSMKNEDRKQAETALQHVGMFEYKNRLIGDLSGGQQQRVFIARAIAAEPEIILLDEPTSGVDGEMQDELYALLKELNQKLDLTLVLVSHDIERVVKEVMHVACVNKTLDFHLSPQEYYTKHH
jgi:zinc transport system ATP-binding protein